MKTCIQRWLIAVIFTFVLSLTGSAQARELVVALSNIDYPPFYFVENGKYKGSSMEIAQAVAE